MQQNDFQTYPFGNIPKRLNDFFKPENRDIVGRTEELAQVRRDLLEGRATVLVNGIGGIGKTTIARKYVERHWDDYQHIAWLTVNAPQSVSHDPHKAAADEGYSPMHDAFLRSTALWRSLGIETQVERYIEVKDLRGAFDLICQRLGQLQGCLLIIDNANDAADLLENRPALKSLNAHVLVTSRAKPKEWNIVEVNELPPPLAVELFKQHYAHPSLAKASELELNALVETLLRHTLLLELVGKSASKDGNNLPFPKLLKSLEDKSFHNRYLNELPVDGGDHADGQNLRRQATVESYIALMFSHIRWEEPERKDLLKAMTLLPPATSYESGFLTEICQLLNVDFQSKRADFLVQYGWLNREPLLEGGVGYSMHPLILDVAFRELGVTAEWAEGVIDHTADRINYDNLDPNNLRDLHEKRKFQPFAEHIGKLFWESDTASVSWLLDRWATLEKINGYIANAVRCSERALAIAEKKLSEESIAVHQSNLAILYGGLGEYTRSRDLLESALATELKNFDPEHPRVALRQSNLGEVYRNLGEYARACDLLETALASNLKNYDSEHPQVTNCKSVLAIVVLDMGDYARACDLLESALASDLKNFGYEHPMIIMYKSSLGSVYNHLGETARSRDMFEEALELTVKNFGFEHSSIAMHQSNLATANWALGQYTVARDLLEAALASSLKIFDPKHPNIAIHQSNLATVFSELGEHYCARILFEASLDSTVKNFGFEHSSVAVIRNNLAMVCFYEKNYSDAIEQLQEALRIIEKAFGREHPNYKTTSKSLAAAQKAAQGLAHD